MKCVECNNIMISLELDEVEIDFCQGCGGIWLDSGELEILLAKTAGAGSFPDNLKPAIKAREKSIRCPLCRKRMEKVAADLNRELILDRCPGGDGFWLNKGELASVFNSEDRKRGNAVEKLLRDIFLIKT